MENIIFLSVAAILFLSICIWLRFFKKEWIEEWEVMDKVWFLTFIPLGCIFWPLTLPLAILAGLGVLILGFFKRDNNDE